jgi:hypothetical protein
MRLKTDRVRGRRSLSWFRALAGAAILAVVLGNTSQPVIAGAPLYPDLVTLPPSGLYVERNSAGHYLIRFNNTAGNLGGRLEISVDSFGSKTIYQNVYDQNVGGSRVVRQQVHSDLIYHPQHNHFHFSGFAQYELLKKSPAGSFDVTHRTGSKTSFCILDTVRINSQVGQSWPIYNTCGSIIQGMSAGWGDTYVAALFDQWIDVGTTMIPDGQYAIRSTADPDNRIFETNDFNNIGIQYFTIANGRVVSTISPPLCTIEQSGGTTSTVDTPVATKVGQVVRLACSRFQAGEEVDIHWGSVNTAKKATVTASSSGTLATFVEIPPSSLGVHYWIAKGQSSGTQAAAIVNTIPSVEVAPARGDVGTKVTATLRGFSPSEVVTVKVYKAGSVVASETTTTVSGSGSGDVQFPIPAIPFGAHKIEAVGNASGAIAVGSLAVSSTVELDVEEALVGDDVGATLRGFVAGETVTLTIGPAKIEVGEVVASHSGSASPSSAEFEVPDLPAGAYLVYATGNVSGIAVFDELEIDSNGSSTDPTETPTSTLEPTSTETSAPTETPTATSTPENQAPTADAGADQEIVDSDLTGSESVTVSGVGSSDPEGGQLVASWSIDGSEVANTLDAQLDLAVGIHTLTLTVTDDHGATASDDVVILISAPDPPTETPTPTP